MNWLYKLQRKFGRYSIENLMIYITLTMLAVYVLQAIMGIPVVSWLSLSRAAVMRGQVWRLLTFVFVPPMAGMLTMVISLYFYYFIGSSLERAWGAFQFNVYYLFGVLGAIVAALISGRGDNTYLNLSLFLAFAQLYPEERVLLFFVIPVKIKWLAWLDWALFAVSLVFGSWSTRAAIIASLVNFFIFFGPDILSHMRNQKRYGAVRRNFRNEMRRGGRF